MDNFYVAATIQVKKRLNDHSDKLILSLFLN
nr:MAG TPA: hypothetical protein [Caudoviricetes sp.]